MNKNIKAFLICFLVFLIVALYIYISQRTQFENLIKEKGRYTIGIGKDLDNRKVGGNTFTFEYKVNDKLYEGKTSATGHKSEMTVGGVYFVLFDSSNPKKNFLIRYPAVPEEINLESSIPEEGWKELPIPTDKKMIRHFLENY